MTKNYKSVVNAAIIGSSLALMGVVAAPVASAYPEARICEPVPAEGSTVRATVCAYIEVSAIPGRLYAAGTVKAESPGTVVTAVRVQLWVNEEKRVNTLCNNVVSAQPGDERKCEAEPFDKDWNHPPYYDEVFATFIYRVEGNGPAKTGTIRSDHYRY
ncbi:hypothetical protein ACWIGW_39710 [Nocardia brasiliensis]